MQAYQPYWAARGHLLALDGQKADAISSLTIAIGLTTDPAIRTYLQARIGALQDG